MHDARGWYRRWLEREPGNRPWVRARTHYELARRGAFAHWPLHGPILWMLREGMLEIGRDVILEPHVKLVVTPPGRITVGAGTYLNAGIQVAAVDHVSIGAHCLFGPGCFIADSDHRFDDLERTITEQGFTSRGPTIIGDHVWLGANAVVTSGVTIGDRCVVGANAVVTSDLAPRTIAVGVPARTVGAVGA